MSAVDDKGRLSVPADLRALVDHSSGGRYLNLTKHENLPCLIGFGRSRQADMLAEIDREEQVALGRNLPYDRDAAGRKKFSLLQDVAFDASGRFVMPPLLRAIGRIETYAFFHGNGSFFCIWNPSVLLEQGDDFAAEKMAAEFFLDEMGKKK